MAALEGEKAGFESGLTLRLDRFFSHVENGQVRIRISIVPQGSMAMNCWRYLPGAGLDEPVSENFRGLAALWDQLAGHGGPPFRHEFFPDLEVLRQFQLNFPDRLPIPQMIGLQIKAADMLRKKFQESGMADGPTWLEKLN